MMMMMMTTEEEIVESAKIKAQQLLPKSGGTWDLHNVFIQGALYAFRLCSASASEPATADYECENCIGMPEYGCYCQALGATGPGGPGRP